MRSVGQFQRFLNEIGHLGIFGIFGKIRQCCVRYFFDIIVDRIEVHGQPRPI
jgi:hypothetical protein